MWIFLVTGSFATKLRCRLIECLDILVFKTEKNRFNFWPIQNSFCWNNFLKQIQISEFNWNSFRIKSDLARHFNVNFGKFRIDTYDNTWIKFHCKFWWHLTPLFILDAKPRNLRGSLGLENLNPETPGFKKFISPGIRNPGVRKSSGNWHPYWG